MQCCVFINFYCGVQPLWYQNFQNMKKIYSVDVILTSTCTDCLKNNQYLETERLVHGFISAEGELWCDNVINLLVAPLKHRSDYLH